MADNHILDKSKGIDINQIFSPHHIGNPVHALDFRLVAKIGDAPLTFEKGDFCRSCFLVLSALDKMSGVGEILTREVMLKDTQAVIGGFHDLL